MRLAKKGDREEEWCIQRAMCPKCPATVMSKLCDIRIRKHARSHNPRLGIICPKNRTYFSICLRISCEQFCSESCIPIHDAFNRSAKGKTFQRRTLNDVYLIELEGHWQKLRRKNPSMCHSLFAGCFKPPSGNRSTLWCAVCTLKQCKS